MNALRRLAVALAAGAVAFFLAIPSDNRPFCGGLGPSTDNCHFGPAPIEWYPSALPVAITVFLAILIGLWTVQRRTTHRDGDR
jgi:hypothetical protein